MDICWRENLPHGMEIKLHDDTILPYTGKYRYHLKNDTAQALASDEQGNPVFSINEYGKGKVLLLAIAVEKYMADTHNSFSIDAPQHWVLYQKAAKVAGVERILRSEDQMLSVTLHRQSANEYIAVVVNNRPEARSLLPVLAEGWKMEMAPSQVEANSGVILKLTK